MRPPTDGFYPRAGTYGLPQVNKASAPLIPIAACRGSPTYNMAKCVAKIIKPLMGKTQHLNNNMDLINKLKDVTVKPDEELVSYNANALFTCVPVEDSILY